MLGGNSRVAKIRGMGYYIPNRVVGSDEIEDLLGLEENWIREHTGVEDRHFASDEQTNSDLAVEAIRRALDMARLSIEDVQLLIYAASAGDMAIPCTASIVANKLGAENIAVFDVDSTCLSFLVGLDIANQFITTGRYDRVLVVTAEITSRVINWKDRDTCVLLGDGASATVLEPGDKRVEGIQYSTLAANCGSWNLATILGGGNKHHPNMADTTPEMNLFEIKGRSLTKQTLRHLPPIFWSIIENSDFDLNEIKTIITHQANLPGIKLFFKRLGIPLSKLYTNIERYGNTAAASIPIALAEALEERHLNKGDKVILVGVGAGLTFGGSALIV